MPGGDRTSLFGAGPRSGLGTGDCSGYNLPGDALPDTGLRGRFGSGRGCAGHGWRHRFSATGIPGWVPPTAEQETAALKAQADWLRGQLDAIQKRIEELTSK